jgi:hypothetical protein
LETLFPTKTFFPDISQTFDINSLLKQCAN